LLPFILVHGLPDACYSLLVTDLNAGYITVFGFAGRTCVSDFFAMFLCDCGYKFVFKINKHGFHLQGVLRTFLDAVAATVAFLRINYYVIFA